MEKSEKLKDRLNYLNKLINKYEHQLLQLKQDNYELFFVTENEKTRQLKNKISKLLNEAFRIEQFFETSDKKPIISNESVDLYKNDENPKGCYLVCLHETKTIIGEVGCNNENNNIHYVIDDEYQNNGYGFQALVAMVNYLILSNVENIEIIIWKENTVSIKLAEKLKIIFPCFEKKEINNCIFYRFNLNKIIDEKSNISGK